MSCQTITSYIIISSISSMVPRMVSAAEISRTARVLEVRAPSMRTLTRRGTLRGDPRAVRTRTTADRASRVTGRVTEEADLAAMGTKNRGEMRLLNLMTHLIPRVEACQG